MRITRTRLSPKCDGFASYIEAKRPENEVKLKMVLDQAMGYAISPLH